jgi:hypothetical protein
VVKRHPFRDDPSNPQAALANRIEWDGQNLARHFWRARQKWHGSTANAGMSEIYTCRAAIRAMSRSNVTIVRRAAVARQNEDIQ